MYKARSISVLRLDEQARTPTDIVEIIFDLYCIYRRRIFETAALINIFKFIDQRRVHWSCYDTYRVDVVRYLLLLLFLE